MKYLTRSRCFTPGRFAAATATAIFGWLLITAGCLWIATAPVEAAAVDPTAPVGETKPFHGTLVAKDPRLGTLSLGSRQHVSRVLALDATSRLVKGVRPSSLADFAVGDVLEGYAFPDQYGRLVVAVATANARPLTAAETKPHAPRKARAGGNRRGGSRRAGTPVAAPVQAPAETHPVVEPTSAPDRSAHKSPPASRRSAGGAKAGKAAKGAKGAKR